MACVGSWMGLLADSGFMALFSLVLSLCFSVLWWGRGYGGWNGGETMPKHLYLQRRCWPLYTMYGTRILEVSVTKPHGATH